MRSSKQHRFTVFDVMDAQGVFDENSANAASPHYRGPVKYPMMFYHPRGEERIIQRAEIVVTPLGPEKVGELREIVTRIANDEEDEKALREAGWHDHPAKAMAAAGKVAPPIATDARVNDLEATIAALQKQLEEARAVAVPVPMSEDDAALMRSSTRV